MKHYLKSKDGEIKYTVDMYCEHPNMKNNNTDTAKTLTVSANDVLNSQAYTCQLEG